MIPLIRATCVIFTLLTVITGVLYPAAVTLCAQAAFPRQAQGSLVLRDGTPIGSSLLGQSVEDPGLFWGRPSATGPFANNPLGGSGSNQGPTNPALLTAVQERCERLRNADPDQQDAIPIELVTASGSGLDPHISPAAALYQAPRVARVRGLPVEQVRELIREHVEPPTFGFLGQPRVNVMLLNLALPTGNSP